ncbi:MAG: hypothetical protein ABI954_12455 [Pyrinomonadaceae bacterium]
MFAERHETICVGRMIGNSRIEEFNKRNTILDNAPAEIVSSLRRVRNEQGVRKRVVADTGNDSFIFTTLFVNLTEISIHQLSLYFEIAVEKILLFTQLATTLALTGIIWLVQIVHYPLFQFVGDARYREFHEAHMNWITYIVAPLMIAEAVTAGLIIFYPPLNSDNWLLWLGLILVIVVWASTFFLQVPLHEKLAQGFDVDTHRMLVKTNWIRTVAWTIRSIIVLWLAWKA